MAVAAQRLDEVVDDTSVPLPDLIALTTLRAQVAMIRYADDQRPEDLRAAVEGFERVRSDLLADQPAHPLAAPVHTGLAAAHHSAGKLADAVDSGLRALRAYGNDVLLQTGTAHALDAARHAAALAGQVADWCLDDAQPQRALEALELGRGLVLHSAIAGTTVPDLLRAAGHLDLAADWEAAPAAPGPVGTAGAAVEQVNAELIGVPSDLRPRVLAALHGSGVAGQRSARDQYASAVECGRQLPLQRHGQHRRHTTYAYGKVVEFLFYDQDGRRLLAKPVEASVGHPAKVKLDLTNVVSLRMTCSSRDTKTNDQNNTYAVFGDPIVVHQ